MWVLKFLPDWVFYGLTLIGFAGLLFSRFIPAYYRSAVQATCAAFFVFGVYMSGAISNEAEWQARIKELEAKIAVAEEQSKTANAQVDTKVVTKVQIVKTRGDEIIRYVEVQKDKIDANCVVPKEFIEIHNRAAEQPK